MRTQRRIRYKSDVVSTTVVPYCVLSMCIAWFTLCFILVSLLLGLILREVLDAKRKRENERWKGRQRQRQGDKKNRLFRIFSLIRWLSQPHRHLVWRPISHRNMVCIQHCNTTTVHCAHNRPKCNRVRNSSMRRSPGMTENKIHIMKLNFHFQIQALAIFVRYINCTREAIYRTRNIRIGWFTHTW